MHPSSTPGAQAMLLCPYMLSWLFSKPLSVGSIAPDFTLLDQQGTVVTLSALRGHNVVLIFYPGDDTRVCRKQLCEFRDNSGLSASKDTLVFGVNPQGADAHSRFHKKRRLSFPLLVDKGKRVAQLYSAAGPLVRRTVYLIGKDGHIRYARRGKPAPEEVLGAAQT